jgi:predicted peroxiredoxin
MDSTYEMVKELIDFNSEGVDTYNHNGSTWLIFTDNKKWVIELTKEKTLWYNYYFFTGVFKYLSLDVVENQHYITKWVEDTIINSVKSTKGEYYKEIQKVEYTIHNGVKDTIVTYNNFNSQVENTIQTGVKHTIDTTHHKNKYVEDAIQNGVKRTIADDIRRGWPIIEDAIQNGVKKTKRSYEGSRKQRTKDTIQNGVKHTSNRRLVVSKDIEDTIQNGVKRTLQKNINRIGQVEDTIQNGVKHTHPMGKDKESIVSNDFGMNEAIQNGVKHTQGSIFDNPTTVKDTIQNGVKETHRDAERHPKTVEDAIQNGVKVTYSDKIPHEYDWSNQFTEEIDDIIQNGVKHTEKSLQIDGSCVIEDVIKEGVKHTEYGDWEDGDERLDDIIDNGVKETTPGGYLGSVEMKGKIVHQFEHSKQDDDVKDVIKNGIKKTEAAALFDEESKMDTVISNGIKETHDDAYHHTGRVGGVIKNGVKQCIPSRTPLYNPMDFSVQYRENHRLDDVASVLEKGIKEVQPLPSQEGNMDYSNYYYRQGVSTKPHTQYVNDVITNGIKKTKAMDEWVNTNRIVDGVISRGVKKSPI